MIERESANQYGSLFPRQHALSALLILGTLLDLPGCTSTGEWSSGLLNKKNESLEAPVRHMKGQECSIDPLFFHAGDSPFVPDEFLRLLKKNAFDQKNGVVQASEKWSTTHYGLWSTTCIRYEATLAKILQTPKRTTKPTKTDHPSVAPIARTGPPAPATMAAASAPQAAPPTVSPQSFMAVPRIEPWMTPAATPLYHDMAPLAPIAASGPSVAMASPKPSCTSPPSAHPSGRCISASVPFVQKKSSPKASLPHDNLTITKGDSGSQVVVKKDLLNILGTEMEALEAAFQNQSAPPQKKIARVVVSGTSGRDTAFVARSLGVGPGDALDSPSVGALPDNLYALSQVPGYARADALLVPSASLPGFDDLAVKVTPSSLLAGSQIELDNYGYAAMGQVTLNGTLDLNNTLLPGDQWTVALTGSPFGSTPFFGMESGTIAYSAQAGLTNRLGATMNAINYALGGGWSPWGHGATVGQLLALGVSGSNYSFDGWGSHAFVQTPTTRLTIKGDIFLKELQDTYSSTEQNDRSVTGGTLDLSGSKTWINWSGSFDIAMTEYDLSQGAGSSSQNPFYDTTPGLRNYWTANGGIRYAFTPVYAVYLSTMDQQTLGAPQLDPMLEGVLGGMSNIRALPTAALFGNDLYSGSLSFIRTDTVARGQLLSSLFFDAGNVTGVGFSYGAMGPGIEESWTGQHVFGKADLAIPVGPLPVVGMGSPIVSLTGGNIAQGGAPLELWLSAGIHY